MNIKDTIMGFLFFGNTAKRLKNIKNGSMTKNKFYWCIVTDIIVVIIFWFLIIATYQAASEYSENCICKLQSINISKYIDNVTVMNTSDLFKEYEYRFKHYDAHEFVHPSDDLPP